MKRLKRLAVLLLAIAMAFGTLTAELPAVMAADGQASIEQTYDAGYKTLYKNYLKYGTITISESMDKINISYFSIKDIDKNGIPELICYGSGYARMFSGVSAVYTVKNGKMVQLLVTNSIYQGNNPGSLGTIYYQASTKSLIIKRKTASDYGASSYVVKASKSEMKLTHMYSCVKVTSSDMRYSVTPSGKEVSRAAFNAYRKKYFSGLTKIPYHKNTSANRAKYVK